MFSDKVESYPVSHPTMDTIEWSKAHGEYS